MVSWWIINTLYPVATILSGQCLTNTEAFTNPIVTDGRTFAIQSGLRLGTRTPVTVTEEHEGDDDNDDERRTADRMSRRSAVLRSSSALAAGVSFLLYSPPPSFAAVVASTPTPVTKRTPISASWNSIDGLKTNDENKSNNKFVSFDPSAYKAMKDDLSRTPLFEKAISDRLNNSPDGLAPKDQVVLDLGTGPFALFAVYAAQAGAGRVYAVEANREAAKSARATIAEFGLQDVVTVIEGFSTEITLPSKADFAVAEIVGSVATEEGAYATVLDAHERHLKDPKSGSSWIPSRIQTYAAPAGYTLHNLFRPPAFDWGKLDGEPVRFNCRDQALQLLSDPVLVEDVSFKDIRRKPPPSPSGTAAPVVAKEVSFTIDEARLVENADRYRDELRRGGLRKLELETTTLRTSESFTGVALWPRLFLDGDEGEVRIDTRSFPRGDHNKSHWQTVLPIMSGEPVRVEGGDVVRVEVEFRVPDDVLVAPQYKLVGEVVHRG